jgi:DNA-binding XRE family transcriptional regulator
MDRSQLQRLRILRAWTQRDLAQAAGLTPRTVATAEAGRAVAFSTARDISLALETSLSQLCPNLGPVAQAPATQVTRHRSGRHSG